MSERHVTVDAIVQAVGSVTGFGRSELLSERRHIELAHARFAIYWLAQQMTSLSLVAIGRAFGDRDHSTVSYGIERAEQLRASDETFRLTTDAILGALIGIQRSGMISMAALADPIATARRVLAAPEREAVRVPVGEIVAMARLIAERSEPSSDLHQETDHAA